MVTPIAASFSRAISASSSRGIRCTSFVSSRACFTTLLGGERLIRERHVHHARGMAFRRGEVDEPAVGQHEDPLSAQPPLVTNSRTRVGPWAACFRLSRSISTLKWPEFASTAPSFITRMCSTPPARGCCPSGSEDIADPGGLGHRHHPITVPIWASSALSGSISVTITLAPAPRAAAQSRVHTSRTRPDHAAPGDEQVGGPGESRRASTAPSRSGCRPDASCRNRSPR